jgi:hypothetical protein
MVSSKNKVALIGLKYVFLVPVLLIFAILMTVAPILYSIDFTLSKDISKDVIVAALKEGIQGQPDVFNIMEKNCELQESVWFENYSVPCDIVRDWSRDSVAQYLVDTYPHSYYELIPGESAFGISEAVTSVIKIVLYALIILSLFLMYLIAGMRIHTTLNYLSLGLVLSGIVYIITNGFLVQLISSLNLPAIISAIVPSLLPPSFIGYLYLLLSALVKIVELFENKLL